MKLISYKQNGKINLGHLENDMIYDLYALDAQIADNMQNFLEGGEYQLQLAKTAVENGSPTISEFDIEIVSPVPNPPIDSGCLRFPTACGNSQKQSGLGYDSRI